MSMMAKSSIFYSITFTFLLSIISVFLAFMFLMDFDKKIYTDELNTKYSIIARATLFHLNNFIDEKELQEQVKDYKMRKINEQKSKDFIIKEAKIIQKIESKIGNSSILKYKKYHYLLIEHENSVSLFKDEDFQPYRYDLIKIIFIFVLLIIVIAYILTIRRIKPLRRLKRQMDKFATGSLDIDCRREGDDEISQVSNSFANAIEQIKDLNNSRQLFLRNIMHELKTPITKGRISVEMIDNTKQKDRLIKVFEKLEFLINEFASIEQITSGAGIQNVKPTRLVDIIDESIDLAMVPTEQIKLEIEDDLILNIDFRLFTTAMKNLIDNGIKYSIDKFIIITADKNKICFISKGSPLEHQFEHYLQPFTQAKSSHQSFGLGLYIVDNIIKAHKLKFVYKHENGLNYFSFENIKILL